METEQENIRKLGLIVRTLEGNIGHLNAQLHKSFYDRLSPLDPNDKEVLVAFVIYCRALPEALKEIFRGLVKDEEQVKRILG